MFWKLSTFSSIFSHCESATKISPSVLRNVDGLIFVADSQWEKMEENVESFQNMQDNLMEQKIPLDDLPYILQLNKRDLPNAAPVHYLDFLLNQRNHRVPYVEAVAREGVGVFESLNLIARMVLAAFLRTNNLPSMNLPECVAVSAER